MQNYQRNIGQTLIERMTGNRLFVQVVMGPRQVGKTTLVLQVLKKLKIDSQFYLADNVPAAGKNWIQQIWDDARLKLAASEKKEFLLVIDEIQKIENWSEAVKKEWDSDTVAGRNIKVILLGSSRLMLQQGLSESLAGRFETIYIPHWSFTEMQEAFNWTLEQYFWYGAYPATAHLLNDTERLTDYIRNSLIETSLSKDIVMLTRIDKPALLRRLFEIGCLYSTKIVSLTKVQGNLQEKGNLTTLANYLKLLESAGLLTGLEKFSTNVIKQRTSIPKFQVFNNALLSTMLNLNFEKAIANHQLWGQIAESAVGTHLLNKSFTEKYDLFYWNENSKEIDFVIRKNNVVIGLEVKSGSNSANNGISVFNEKFSPKHIFTIGTDGLPFEEFFRMNPSQLFDV